MKKINPSMIELCIVIVLIIVVCCSLFHFEPGECISISWFGKFELRNIDKVVLISGKDWWTVTDTELIGEICDETRIADHVNPCVSGGKRIELYSGDRLVRSMLWGDCCDTVQVYTPDLTHWIIGGIGTEGGGVYLSEDLLAQLNAIMGE